MSGMTSFMDLSQSSSCESSQKSSRPKFQAPFKVQAKTTIETTNRIISTLSKPTLNDRSDANQTGEIDVLPQEAGETTAPLSPVIQIQHPQSSSNFAAMQPNEKKSIPNLRRAKTARYNAVLQLEEGRDSQTSESSIQITDTPRHPAFIYEFQLSPPSKLQGDKPKKENVGKCKQYKKLKIINRKRLINLISQMRFEMAEIRKRQKAVRERMSATKPITEE